MIEKTYNNKFLPKYKGMDWAVHGYDPEQNCVVFSAFHGDYQYKSRYYYDGIYLPFTFKGLGDIIVYDSRYIDW